MKKSRIILTFLLLVFALTSILGGCAKGLALSDYVSELRTNIYYGESDEYKIKAFYGFKEHNYANDGNVGEKVYILSFRLLDRETDGALYSIKLKHNDKDYSANFSLDAISGVLAAKIEIENFAEEMFSVTLSCADKNIEISLASIIPKNIADYKTALNKLLETHKSLIDSFTDENGNFNAEIFMRIIVKDNKAFWYVGFASGNDKLKALLIDAETLEVLAIRDIF